MSISSRIALIIKNQNLSNSAFADLLGVQRSNISHILSGRSKPGLEFLQKVLENFPRVNADWLITGKTKQSETEEPQRGLFSAEIEPEQAETKVREPLQDPKTEKEIDYLLLIYTDGTFEKVSPSSTSA